jgi:hypothetical protein
MTMRRIGIALMLSLALIGISAPSSVVYGAVAIQCQGGPSYFSGFQKSAGAGNKLTRVKAGIDKQATTLCLNPGLAASADSSWVMIEQGAPSANDYIQFGFWNCQTWCNFAPGGGTGGQVKEFVEWNNGNIGGGRRVDFGNIGSGYYSMDIRYYSSGTPRFENWRGGLLEKVVYDDGWRDWSLINASFQMFSESWDVGDQNGGTSSDKEVLDNAQWSLNQDIYIHPISMGSCYEMPNSHGGDFACASFTSTVSYDSVRTWTNSR